MGIMMVIGCLSLIILPLLGFVIGGYYGGVAILACAIPIVALMKARPSR